MTEQAKVPAIRFAGFTDPWEQRKLGELEKDATLYMGRGRVISAKDMSNTPGTFPVYSSSALDNGRMGAYGKYMFNQELITWSIDGGGAVFYRRKHRFSVTNVSGYIAVNPEKINCKFLAYAMSLAHSRIKFDYTVKAHPSVIRSLYTMGIPISLQEQQVIGSFFSRLDNLITLHQRKYDKLVVFKKSMLEKMFPKDGESVPEIRFAGFTDPWEQRKLVELYEKNDERNTFGLGAERTLSIATMTFNSEGNGADASSLPNYKVIRVGDVAFEGHSNKSFAYGRFVVNAVADGIMSPRFSCLRPKNSYPVRFWKYYIHSEQVMRDILVRATKSGTMMNELVIDDLFKQSIAVPQEAEQQAIGYFFSHLDTLITLHQRKLELLRNIKKSLLDRMFV